MRSFLLLLFPPMSRLQRLELFVFAACLFAFAYFHQGGGWNQNARFAEVRALAEQGRFAIDDYLVYKRAPEGEDLVRIPVTRAEFQYEGERYRLSWVDMAWTLFPIDEELHPLAPGVKKSPMISDCASGDIGYVPATGHFHPNKPSGTSLLAVPGYFVIYHVEKWLGINPDHWWVLDVNLWLTSVCSVGLISALGCVLFFRLARDVSEGALVPSLLATFTFAFGTTFFPFSTLLFDHDLTASFLIASVYFIHRATETRTCVPILFAGLCAGLAGMTNLVALGIVPILLLYALFADRRETATRGLPWPRGIWFCAGGVLPAVILFASTWACYGSLRPGTDFQSPLFRDADAFLGMFALPRTLAQFGKTLYIANVLTWSPFRGVFWFAPVLLFGVAGLVVWMREQRWTLVGLCVAIFGFFFLVNVFFNGYHAGFSAGPRYLIPGLPFLALPLVVAFQRWLWPASVFAGASVAINLLLVATDAQNPVGVGGHARVEGRREEITYNLLADYAWPLFREGHARPLLEEQLAVELEKNRLLLSTDDATPEERAAREAALRAELEGSIARGEQSPFLLASVRGPVSVNPLGPYEGLFEYRLYPPSAKQNQWASFNLGEFWFPASRWSLIPLLLITGGCIFFALRTARRMEKPS